MRSRASAKNAGTRMESLVAAYLAAELDDDRIERRRLSGSRDRGDIGSVRTIRGGRVVIEVKDYGGRVEVGPWLREAEVERGNDDATIGVVVFKRRGVSDPAEQGVLMTLSTLVSLLTGGAPTLTEIAADPHILLHD